VVETGNNDLPCDCPWGDWAEFDVAGRGRVAGHVLKAEAQANRDRPLDDYLR